MSRESWGRTMGLLAAGCIVGATCVAISRPNEAAAELATSGIEENHMAVGNISDQNIVWVLDYAAATLSCTPFSREGRFLPTAQLDLQAELKQEGGRLKGKPHFMMTPGTNVRTSFDDVVFITEINSAKLLCIHAAVGARGVVLRVVDRRDLRVIEP